MKPVLGEDEIKSNGYIDLEFENNIIFAKNTISEGISGIVYLSSSEKIISSFLYCSRITNRIRTL